MEDFFRKYSFPAQTALVVIYLGLALNYYFSTPDVKAVAWSFGLLALLSLALAAGLAVWTFRSIQQHSLSRENRAILAAGLVAWGLAQLMWFFFPGTLTYRGVLLNLADLLWYAGSVLLLIVIVFQEDVDARKRSNSTVTWIGISLVVVSSVPIFLSLPALFVMDFAHLLGFLALIIYMGLGLGFIVYAFYSFSFTNRGSAGPARISMAVYLVIMVLAIAAQFFLAWYPPADPKFVVLPNLVFSGASILLAANIYLSWSFEQQSGLETKLKLGFIGKEREIPEFLLHTDAEGKIVFVSSNFLKFTNNSLPERYIGKPLRESLGLSESEFEQMTETCSRGAFIIQHDIRVAAGQKAPVPLFMTVAGSISGNEYFGLDVVLHLPNYSRQAYPLDPESSAIVQGILKRTGRHSKENGALLAQYLSAQIRGYKELITNARSAAAAAALDREVNSVAEKNKWPIHLADQDLNIEPGVDDFDNAELIKAMPVLFRIARQYAASQSSPESVARQTAGAEKGLNDKVLFAARQFGLR